MLSVIILCGEASAQALVRTLTPLVEASVMGLVRDVVLAGQMDKERALIADHAGCALVEASNEAEALTKAPPAARGEALMILYAGYSPEPGFLEELDDLLATGTARREVGSLLYAAPERLRDRLFPSFAPVVGLIASREACMAKPVASFRELRKLTGARKMLQRRLRRIA